MAIEVGGHKAGNDFSVAVNRAVEPVEGRLRCIEEAVKKGFKEDDQWADWLKAGVKVVSGGGVVTPEWLQKFDESNSYI